MRNGPLRLRGGRGLGFIPATEQAFHPTKKATFCRLSGCLLIVCSFGEAPVVSFHFTGGESGIVALPIAAMHTDACQDHTGYGPKGPPCWQFDLERTRRWEGSVYRRRGNLWWRRGEDDNGGILVTDAPMPLPTRSVEQAAQRRLTSTGKILGSLQGLERLDVEREAAFGAEVLQHVCHQWRGPVARSAQLAEDKEIPARSAEAIPPAGIDTVCPKSVAPFVDDAVPFSPVVAPVADLAGQPLCTCLAASFQSASVCTLDHCHSSPPM